MTNARRLPDFIIIGAMKCGTTTLYRHLNDHPGIDMSRDKETDFFIAEKSWDRGLPWYSAQFVGNAPLCGEASPNYTKARDFPGVPARVAATCPGVRLIYILRDPVARAESQFRHGVTMGELDPSDVSFADDHEYAHIMDASRYAHQLDLWLEHFRREAILLLDFDDLKRDAQSVMDQVHSHIGAPSRTIDHIGAMNDSAQLSRVPAPILSFGQSPLGRRVLGLIGRDTRDRIRSALALGRRRAPPPLPDALLARMRAELAPDAARLRTTTGLQFAGWSV